MPDDMQQLLTLFERHFAGPSDNTLWDLSDVAAYLKMERKTVSNSYRSRPDFPACIRPGGKGQPLWEPRDIKAWARKFKEKKPN